MKTIVISYSLTGNNGALAESLSTAIGADHAAITESRPRTMGTITWDMILNRTPKIDLPVDGVEGYDLVLFVGPVWMGYVASPFRACFKQLGGRIDRYGFVSISGGADGPNAKLKDDLTKRLAKAPICLVDLHVADLLPR